jgi:hypothetical protein
VTERASVDAAIAVEPSVVTPSQTTMVTCTATVPRSLMLSEASLRIEAFAQDTTLGLGPYSVGTQQWRVLLHIPTAPIEGEVHFRLVARVQDAVDSADATLSIVDDGPPRLLLQMPLELGPPDSLSIVLQAEDAAGITDITVHLRGAAFRDIAMQYEYNQSVFLTHAIWLSRSTPLGDSIVLTAETHDGFGHTATQYHRTLVVDRTPPSVTVHVDTVQHSTPIDMSSYPLLFFPGDSVRVHLSASDNYGLAWVGFEYLGVKDSIATDSVTTSADFGMQVPRGANTDEPIWAFARDRAGDRRTASVYAIAMDGRYRAISDQVQDYGAIPDAGVLDERNDILYFVSHSESVVHRLGLAPLTPMGPILLNRPTVSVGLSPGRDTVWVLLADNTPQVTNPNLLIGWNLASGPSAIDTIWLPGPVGCHPHAMRITANNHAVVTRGESGCGALDVNLATKAVSPLSLSSGLIELAGAADLKTVVAWNERYVQVYLPETAFIGTARRLYDGSGYPNQEPAFDRAGTDILLRNRLYDHLFTSFRWMGSEQRDLPGTQALSWDNTQAFVGSIPGYWRFDVASGAEIERVILPRQPTKLIVHPDGQRLIVFGDKWVGEVDLR